jgi:hypothetical protein
LEWVLVPGDVTPQDASRRQVLDGVLRMDARGGLNLMTPEAPRQRAAWHDWSTQRPVTFASLFPGRVDCAELTLPQEMARPGAAGLLRSMIEAAAALSRHPSRLSVEDRLRGRMPRIDTLRAVGLPPTGDNTRDAQRLVVHGLWESMLDAMKGTSRAWCVPAARVVSAFAVGVDDDLPDTIRLEMVEACASVAPQEPEVQLRLAAARFAAYQDSLALDALLEGERLLRGHELNAGTSQLPFIQAELEAGRGTTISLGRVAAGIAMVCASLQAEHIPYFRDDVLDDARYSEWLIPKDQDRRVLLEVFRGIMADRTALQAQRLAA